MKLEMLKETLQPTVQKCRISVGDIKKKTYPLTNWKMETFLDTKDLPKFNQKDREI